MKEVINVAIGNKSFTLEKDAYEALKEYLDAFKRKSTLGVQSEETMRDLEERIAEILSYKVGPVKNVVDINMINEIIDQLGMPDGEPYRRSGGESANFNNNYSYNTKVSEEPAVKRVYRDSDNASLGGVCMGLGYYLNVDPTLIKIAFVLLFLAGCSGLLIYIILWIVVPKATTPAQKCEMRGWPKTAENLDKFRTKR